MTLAEYLARAPVVPVLVVESLAHARPLAETLADAGLMNLEVTLRTPVALEVIQAMGEAVPDALVGAGTVLDPEAMHACSLAGARFAISPGFTAELAATAARLGLPWMPGVMTPSEAMAARMAGYRLLKLFPADVAGGVACLKAFASPLADIRFCPTGGIKPETAADYLALPNVLCVGGSWIAPPDLVREENWKEIGRRAKQAAAIRV